MDTAVVLDGLLDRHLRRHSIREAFVCGRRLHPLLYSHVVTFPRLEIPLKGCYENQIEKDGQVVTVRLQPGTALFAAPNCWNLPTWRLNVELISLLFGKKHLGISHVVRRGPEVPQLAAQKFSTPLPITGPLPRILDAMVELQNTGGAQEIYSDLAQALIRCVRELLHHPVEPKASRAQVLLESMCVYLQNHYQYDITRDSVAQQFGITPNHLSRLFQTHGNMSLNNYLTYVRINRGKHLLCNYNLKLDDVAALCGFRDTPYFCRIFKKLAKMTPAEYRAARTVRTK
jgi:AraC-like DNA-binding protein